MSDSLTISGGGSTAVSTTEMLVSASALQRTAGMSRDIAGAISMVDARLTTNQLVSLGIPTAAALAENDLECAFTQLHAVADRAERLSGLVRFAADSYGLAEAFAEGLTRKFSAEAAALFGFLFPKHLAVLGVTLVGVPVVLGFAAAAMVTGRQPAELMADKEFMARLNTLISDPLFVQTVRFGVMNVDEIVAGAAGLPPVLVGLLSTTGVIGLSSSAAGVGRIAGLAGKMAETPVALVSKSDTSSVKPAQTVEERAERIPQPTDESPFQVSIETTSRPGEEDTFELYIGGTVDFAFGDSAQPFDGSSNVNLAAGQEAAALKAVLRAMAEAGITAESEVVINGYSQGAAVAALIAASGDFNVTGVLSFGGNTGQIPIPVTVDTVLVEHEDDIVPAVGGPQDNQHATVVTREAFGGRELPEGVLAPAHQLSEYRETARLMDSDDSEELRAVIAQLTPKVYADASTTVTSYEFERVKP
ncbi:hypothetical protein ESZ53_09450 [Salinibacterium sp. UTAS2018]|uniref:hypothetical protein n=1 Tax=Salinibacterium sp. UTAS2018 TaxID=2508880 RepID=UPI001009750F|nr:hypothetical protein [Salinibacterium sp. UTAS2018]QAV70642.1 hypothetical protein ESZ53_09450 [Salinibacterium sp. UTAS2018]